MRWTWMKMSRNPTYSSKPTWSATSYLLNSPDSSCRRMCKLDCPDSSKARCRCGRSDHARSGKRSWSRSYQVKARSTQRCTLPRRDSYSPARWTRCCVGTARSWPAVAALGSLSVAELPSACRSRTPPGNARALHPARASGSVRGDPGASSPLGSTPRLPFGTETSETDSALRPPWLVDSS